MIFGVGESLRKVISLLYNEKFIIKMNIVFVVNDVYFIDINYYKNCCLKNVSNVLRKFLFFGEISFILASEIVVKIFKI